MPLTRDYRDTVVTRIRRDRKFARLFYAGAIEMLLEGQTAEALSRLRDLVHAGIRRRPPAQDLFTTDGHG